MLTKEFWTATVERAVKSFAQGLLMLVTGNATGVLDINWVAVLSGAAFTALLSVLTSVGSVGIGAPGPSLVGEQLTTKP